MGIIMAIDQGTTSTKTLIIDEHRRILGQSSATFAQHYPQPGWVEHRAFEIKESVQRSVEGALCAAAIDPCSIDAIGITNQRETICLFDSDTQSPLPFIVWQCRRSQPICERLKDNKLEARLHRITGLHIDPYFSASKLQWIFEEYPEQKRKAESGELMAGTIDSFLCHWFSHGSLHITDVTNASRTMLMDLKSCAWSDECLDIFSIPKRCLPEIKKCTGPFGFTKNLSFLPDGIPIAAIAGDQHAALFGHHCFNSGNAKATFGTGCFILLNTGPQLYFSTHGLLSSIAFQLADKPVYCLEGSAFIAGAALQFLIDAFGLIKHPSEIEALACSVPDNGGVIFVPALCGLGAPHWQPDATGLFTGLTRGTLRGHVARATLEGIALQNTDIIDAMTDDAFNLSYLNVDGGAAQSDLLMQIQADLLNVICRRSQCPHKTALGIAEMAGLAVGIYRDLDHLTSIKDAGTEFVPNADRSWAQQTINSYRQATKSLL